MSPIAHSDGHDAPRLPDELVPVVAGPAYRTDGALNPERLAKLCAEMRKRFAEGPPELRQAYMKLLLEKAEIDGVETRLTGSKALLAKFAETGGAFSVPEVLTDLTEFLIQAE